MKQSQPAKEIDGTKSRSSFFQKEGGQGFFRPGRSDPSFFSKKSPRQTIQPKLTIGQPNDVFEKEADAMADKVVQGSAGALVQKKCAHCEQEEEQLQKKPIFESEAEVVQRRPDHSGATTASPAIEKNLQSSKGSGALLPDATREQMESGFGVDFSRVRIHDNTPATEMSKGLNAQAFTHGNDIYFNKGKYDTKSGSGKHLLAHELTHVVQQGGAAARVNRFNSAEHKELGDSTGIMVSLGNGLELSFGDIVALAGDEYGSPEELWDDTQSPEGLARIRAHLEHANISPGLQAKMPAPDDDTKSAAEKAYYALALKNISHFSGGGTAAQNWFFQHATAVGYAMDAGLHGNPEAMNKANFTEAFAGHYLTDSFSSGHVRTPRKEINDYYVNEFAPLVYDHMVDTLRERAVDEIEDQCESQTILNGPLPIHIRRGRIRDNINAKLNAALSKIGGREGAITYLGEVLGGVVSLAMHDEDNKHGLWVSSKAHPQPWMAFGDSNLNAPMISNPLEAGMHMLHKQLIEKAIQVSLSDLQKAYVIGFEKFQQKHNLVSPKYLPDKIYFDFDSDRLNKKNLDTISMLADYLHFHPSTFVNLNGHTDPTGKADYNMDLSIRRANAVKSSLVALGVPADRLHSAGFGKTQLITRNPKQYQKDRRVEFVYQSRPTGVMDDPEKIAFGDVMKEIESKVGPPYAAEDHFPHEVPDNGANLPLNSPLPAWKWGSMSETLRVQINDTIKGYLGDLKSKIATAKELDDTEVSGYTIKIRPVVEKIFDELAADPLGFLGGLMGRKVN